ncbi:hypothetical protein PR048_000961 [Dryococelus australis]|uniref:DDE-1 domain-containing protein n=1 Tax=Dryococelus australis TaxID=614101 RepID=A0ABQ9IG25_9NEOP|nr:hypothetical protein PR048_000961 [Dryococelus australis]
MVEKQGPTQKTMSKRLQRSYDANLKNTCKQTTVKLLVSTARQSNEHNWKVDLNCLKNANSSPKAFRGPKKASFNEASVGNCDRMMHHCGFSLQWRTEACCILAACNWIAQKIQIFIYVDKSTMLIKWQCISTGLATLRLRQKPGEKLKKMGILVLDAFKGHLTPEEKEAVQNINTDFVVIPSGMMSQLQI